MHSSKYRKKIELRMVIESGECWHYTGYFQFDVDTIGTKHFSFFSLSFSMMEQTKAYTGSLLCYRRLVLILSNSQMLAFIFFVVVVVVIVNYLLLRFIDCTGFDWCSDRFGYLTFVHAMILCTFNVLALFPWRFHIFFPSLLPIHPIHCSLSLARHVFIRTLVMFYTLCKSSYAIRF